mmetsp:Transcript_96301/g.171079  ORF Transcript_96301/g.171079 Transcript_96301/m.171079 type:complete len:244 (+) Transcript_96301:762-1493(+)
MPSQCRIVTSKLSRDAFHYAINTFPAVVESLHEAVFDFSHELTETPEGICLRALWINRHDVEDDSSYLVHALHVAYTWIESGIHKQQNNHCSLCSWLAEVLQVFACSVHIIFDLLQKVLCFHLGPFTSAKISQAHLMVGAHLNKITLVAGIKGSLLTLYAVPFIMPPHREIPKQHLPDLRAKAWILRNSPEAEHTQKPIRTVFGSLCHGPLEELCSVIRLWRRERFQGLSQVSCSFSILVLKR